ncbi:MULTISPECIES: putative nitrogen fixation protein NifT [Rhodocyclales]|uniref:Nitrogen fixation protein NifT n=1 Tax=Aromatoleum toluvorans TaxID=92002 RepID=A0ABX1Q0J2_9RHOO|nr:MULTISPECIES: putative nitrogen fixation protein NifT [Rhodocyclales]AYH43395.1 putative nitrogen fixation protein NifT [Azoarcus sp. DN11]NMG44452.1 putative nitrogen fixation protein NifT [Aromatoleum toluvorans]
MKVTVRKEAGGGYSIYVPKKDLEARIVELADDRLWGSTATLDNGWQLELPDLPFDTRLPVTVEARRLAGD